jgi:hypothetical protein
VGWRIADGSAELFLSLPWLYFLLGVRAFLPLHVSPAEMFLILICVVGLIGWARPARLVRGVVLMTSSRFFIARKSFPNSCASISQVSGIFIWEATAETGVSPFGGHAKAHSLWNFGCQHGSNMFKKPRRWRKDFPYYKVQVFSPIFNSWTDKQTAHSTREEADQARQKRFPGMGTRIVEVTHEGKTVSED